MEIFKITYVWYEGDEGETYLGKDVNQIQFEKDISEAKKFAESLMGKEIEEGDYLGKGYRNACLPSFYEQIIWFLVNKKGYIECCINDSDYSVENWAERSLIIDRIDEEIKRTRI